MTKDEFWDSMERLNKMYKDIRNLDKRADTVGLVNDYITDVSRLFSLAQMGMDETGGQ